MALGFKWDVWGLTGLHQAIGLRRKDYGDSLCDPKNAKADVIRSIQQHVKAFWEWRATLCQLQYMEVFEFPEIRDPLYTPQYRKPRARTSHEHPVFFQNPMSWLLLACVRKMFHSSGPRGDSSGLKRRVPLHDVVGSLAKRQQSTFRRFL